MRSDLHLGGWLKTRLTNNDGRAAEDHPVRRNVNDAHREAMSRVERFCARVSDWTGTPLALMGAVAFQALWIVFGTLTRMDPFPFVFLLTCSNVVQLVLIFIVAVGQRQSTRHAELRAEQDHADISRMLYHQQLQEALLLRIAAVAGVKVDDLEGAVAALASISTK